MKSVEGSSDQVEVTMRVVGVDVEEPREESQGTRRTSRPNRRG